MSIQILIGTQDVTSRYESVTFSNIARGGFEAASITVTDDSGIYPGQLVIIRSGLDAAWMGRVNEPGPHTLGGKNARVITALGAGIVLKDGRMTEVFCDRDMSKWVAPSVAQQIREFGFNQRSSQATIAPDSGSPSLLTQVSDTWGATAVPRSSAWYDANGVSIGSLYYAWKQTNANTATFQWYARLSTDAVETTTDSTGNMQGAGPNTGTTLVAGGSGRVYAYAFLLAATAGGAAGDQNSVYWTCLAVYGNHGLTKRGVNSATDAQGFYPADIAAYVAGKVSGIGRQVIGTDPNSYVLSHAVYTTPTSHEQIIDEMAKYLGWSWGVWEPTGMFETLPSFWFAPPPTSATCWINAADGELDPPKVRLDTLYDTCIVTYTDVTGITRSVTVTLTNPLLQAAGLTGKVLDLNAGVSTAARAADQGNAALALAQTAQRGGGSVVMKGSVHLPGGDTLPPELLRAGRDRLRIVDLPDSGSLTDVDTRRYDTFHVERVETTIQRGQPPETRIEFDGGADLLEVLQARLEVARITSAA